MTDADDLVRDDDLRALMERAVIGLDAPTERLRTRAVAGGRRQRRRLRLGTGLVAAATIAVGAMALPQLGAAPTTAHDSTVDSQSSSRGEEIHEPDAPIVGWWDMPAGRMFKQLEALLPPGVEMTAYGFRPESADDHESDRGWVGGRLTVDGIEGTSSIEVLLYPPDSMQAGVPADQPEYSETDQPSATPTSPGRTDLVSCPGNLVNPDSCEEILEDGHSVGRMSEDRYGDLVIREVSLLQEEGMVYVAAANSTSEKWGRGSNVSAAQPPLSMEQLRAIAEGPWAS